MSGHYEIEEWLQDQPPQQLVTAAEGDGWFVAPAVALPEPVGFIFPASVPELLDEISGQGLSRDSCLDLLRRAELANRAIEARTGASDFSLPTIVLIGSPASAQTGRPSRISHFAAWHVPPEGGVSQEAPDDRALASARPRPVIWQQVLDQRHRTTVRRDFSRPASWLAGRRIAVLGCGALGAPIAEHCARAGAEMLFLADSDLVTPGILVRQPYTYLDIGSSKAYALTTRLQMVSPHVEVEPRHGDILEILRDERFLRSFDLVVDATASRSVGSRLELLRWSADGTFPPVMSVMIGHDSRHGVATVSVPESSGGGIDILRRLVVASGGDRKLVDLVEDLFPDPPRTDVFQPELGCSSPTFRGSAVDLAVVGAQLFNGALTLLACGRSSGGALLPTRTAIITGQATDLLPDGWSKRVQWPNDTVLLDPPSDYQIRISPAAFAGIRHEIARAAGEDRDRETGGVLLGQVDPACRVVWVDETYVPPEGVTASACALRLDTDAIRGHVLGRRQKSRTLVTFVGAWHTHPGASSLPSETDLATMNNLVSDGPQSLAHALLIVLGGGRHPFDSWLAGSCHPDIHAQMFFSP
jgi:molybdopterin/thiamine biosynthesis adenylyltransferase/proteasome lid subunit RPN8/RPN11